MARQPEVTHRIMSAIRSANTKPERALGKAMWRRGLRYRKHYKKITGRPDFVFPAAKIAVFCDGDFWHGHNWKLRGLGSLEEELEGYTPFWRDKIRRNVARDNQVNQTLSEQGWKILRFWESEIKKSPEQCAKEVQKIFQIFMNIRALMRIIP